MTIRARRRVAQGSTLEEMTDEELKQIVFFNHVMTGGVTTYTAEGEEWRRAYEILDERGAWKRKAR